MSETASSSLTTGGVQWRNLRTGILFVIGITLMAVLALVIGKNTSALSSKTTYKMFVPDIAGLAENNLVAVAGKKVGTVLALNFASPNDTTVGVEITMLINEEYAYLIREDSKASIKSKGVLGDKFVEIVPGRGQKLAAGKFIEAVPEPGLEDLLNSAKATMSQVNGTIEKINRGEGTLGKLLSSEQLLNQLSQTIYNLDRAVASLTQGNGLVPRLLNDKALANSVASMTTNLSEVSAMLKDGKGSLGKFLVDDAFYTNLNSATRRLDSLVARLENPNGSLGKLSSDPALYKNLSNSAASLDSLLIDLRKNPGRYVTIRVF